MSDKRRKKTTVIVASVVAFVLLVGIAAGAMVGILNADTGYGDFHENPWYPSMTYGESGEGYNCDYIVTMEKKAGEDFVVLNLTDTQKGGFEMLFGFGEKMKKTVRKLVAEVQPDLITLTGDNVWGGDVAYANKYFIKFMDSFGIPWAPVFGNHDGETENSSFNYLANQYIEDSEYCIFKKGPSTIGGIGNYIINITENDKIVQSLVMMDIGDNYVTQGQLDWYKWVIEGVAEQEGHVVESTVMFHVPLPEYKTAYELYSTGEIEGTGECQEEVCCDTVNSGFFELMKELGSTKRVIVGHDHINNFMINYEGIDLIYSLKTGDGCYWVEDGSMNGGTVMTVDKNNEMSVAHHYIKL